MHTRLKQVFPALAIALIGTLLLVGDGTLAILAFAAAIVALPLVYGPDVDEIARATRNGDFDH